MKFRLDTEADTLALARRIAARLEPGVPLLLKGPLGSGKTFLAREAIRALSGTPGPVPSPSFSLLQEYESASGPVAHFDLYRLKHANEVFELDFESILSTHITLIEWPEIVEDYIKERFNPLEIRILTESGGRTAQINLQL